MDLVGAQEKEEPGVLVFDSEARPDGGTKEEGESLRGHRNKPLKRTLIDPRPLL